MAWLEAFPAVPLLGLQWDHGYITSTERMAPLAPFLNKLQEANRGLTLSNPNPWDSEILTTGGFEFKFHTNAVIIGYSYFRPGLPKYGANGLPESVQAKPYLELLEEVLRYADEVLPALAANSIAVKRIGIVATVPVTREQAPPGMRKFFQRLDAVVQGEPIESQCRLVARTAKGESTEDRCIHTVRLIDPQRRAEEASPTLEVVLDYQRHLNPPLPLAKLRGPADHRAFAQDAVKYFEAFGADV